MVMTLRCQETAERILAHVSSQQESAVKHCVEANSEAGGIQWCILVAQLVKTQTLMFFTISPRPFLLSALYFTTQPSKKI